MFDKKLDLLMKLLSVSNSELAKAVYIDPSYISKLRKGKRKAPKSSEFLFDISDYFVELADKKNMLHLLKDIVGCPDEDDTDEISLVVYEWLVLKDSVVDIVSKLMSDISEHDFGELKNSERLIGLQSDKEINITEYYYGIAGKKDCIKKIFGKIIKPDRSVTVFWKINEWDSHFFEEEDHYYEYYELTKELLDNDGRIVLLFSDEGYYIKLIILMNKFLPYFINKKIIPYLYNKADGYGVNAVILVENEITLLRLPNYENLDNAAFMSTNEIGMINYSKGLFDSLLSKSNPIIDVLEYDDVDAYIKGYEQICDMDGRYYYMEANLPFYSLPKTLARKIDKEYPELNFYEVYEQSNRTYLSILKNNGGCEVFDIREREKYCFLFQGKLIEYSKSDFECHLKEIISLMKKYERYEVYISKDIVKNTSLLINDKGGLIIERYNRKNKLIRAQDKKINKQFIRYIFNIREKSGLKTKEEVISYLKNLLD